VEYIAVNTASGRLWSTLAAGAVALYARAQMAAFFPDGKALPEDVLAQAADQAFSIMARGWKRIALAGYTRDGAAAFSHLHGDQYAAFLALLARQLSAAGERDLATRVYLLNKALHGLDLFHEVEIPEVFVFVHPVGTVIGRARLGNFLCIYQNCSIGGSPRDGTLDYPELGDGVLMFAKSTIVGKCNVGSRVVLATGATVVNADVPDDALVAGTSIKARHANVPAFLSRIFTGFAE
jgi:serine O-acetyltransferase